MAHRQEAFDCSRPWLLELRVRITAGSLIVLNTGLGYFVSPWFSCRKRILRGICGSKRYLLDGVASEPGALESSNPFGSVSYRVPVSQDD
jgi:hypothetical protein